MKQIDMYLQFKTNKRALTIDTNDCWLMLHKFKCCNKPASIDGMHPNGHYFEMVEENEWCELGVCDCGLILIKKYDDLKHFIKESLIVPKVTDLLYNNESEDE